MSTSAMEYSIQDAAERLGIPIQKLRRWDEQGVLVALRTDGGHRRYSKELIDSLVASGSAPAPKKPRRSSPPSSARWPKNAASSSSFSKAKIAIVISSRLRMT